MNYFFFFFFFFSQIKGFHKQCLKPVAAADDGETDNGDCFFFSQPEVTNAYIDFIVVVVNVVVVVAAAAVCVVVVAAAYNDG